MEGGRREAGRGDAGGRQEGSRPSLEHWKRISLTLFLPWFIGFLRLWFGFNGNTFMQKNTLKNSLIEYFKFFTFHCHFIVISSPPVPPPPSPPPLLSIIIIIIIFLFLLLLLLLQVVLLCISRWRWISPVLTGIRATPGVYITMTLLTRINIFKVSK